MAHTVNQKAFQVECRCKTCKFQQTFDLDCLVDLRDLSDEPYECHVLKCGHILLERRALVRTQLFDDGVHVFT